MPKPRMIQVENINVPGRTSNVNAEKYTAMRSALLLALPDHMPGLTQAEMLQAVLQFLPETLFPNGAKSGWWVKTVQLDLEAKGVVRRDTSGKLIRWYRA